MIGPEALAPGIYQLKIPFEEIYTSVFLLCSPAGSLVLDGGATAQDAEAYVLTALEALGLQPSLVVRSHSHGDHSGGVERIARAFPQARIALMEDDFPDNGKFLRLYDGDLLLGRYLALNLRGHTDDCLALLDTETKTLLSCDCLQAQGIGKYGTSFTDKAAYAQSVERVRSMGVSRIVASHEFAPYGSQAQGQQAVNAYLDACTIDEMREEPI